MEEKEKNKEEFLKMKVLSFLLAAAMVSAAAVMPVSVSAEENAGGGVLICEENFDNINSLADLTGSAGNGWGYHYQGGDAPDGTGDMYGLESSKYVDLITDEEDGNKYLYVYHNESHTGNENGLYYDIPSPNDGRVTYDYDIKVDGENKINMRFNYGNHQANLIDEKGAVYNAYYENGGKDKILLAGDGTIAPDTWYHVTMTADFNSRLTIIKITDRDINDVVLDTRIAGLENTNARRFCINVIGFNKEAGGKQGAYIDNLKISRIAPTAPAELPFSEDFNYDNIDDMTIAGWTWAANDGTVNVSEIKDSALQLGLKKGYNNQQAKRKFTPVTSGALSVEWDVVPSDYTNAYTYFWGSGTFRAVYFETDNKISINGTPGNVIGDYTPGQTYHCKAVVDMDNKTLDVTVTDAATKEIVAQGSCTHGMTEIQEITLQTWENNEFNSGSVDASYVTFDNLEIKQIPSVSAPVWADGTINADDSYHATTATFTVKPNGVTDFGVEVNVGEQSQTKHIENVESEIKFGIILISDDENNLVTDNVTAGIAD